MQFALSIVHLGTFFCVLNFVFLFRSSRATVAKGVGEDYGATHCAKCIYW